MDSGLECTLSMFVDNIKLCGVDDMLKGRNAMQRDFDKWAPWQLHEVQKNQDQSPAPKLGQFQVQIQAGQRMDKEQS